MRLAMLNALIPTKGIVSYIARNYGNGWDALAGRLKGIPNDTLKAIDAGAPTRLTHLERICDVAKVPTAIFFLPSVPADIDRAILNFRNVERGESIRLSFDAMKHVRRVMAIRSTLEELNVPQAEGDLKAITLDETDVERFALRVRRDLGVAGFPTYKQWRQSLEDAGIAVLQESISKYGVRGFCLPPPNPIIVVSSAETSEARSFTLLHELGHILDGRGAIDTTFAANTKIERLCNGFAAAMLLPKSRETMEILERLAASGFRDIALDEATRLTRASKAALLWRCNSLGLSSHAQILAKVRDIEGRRRQGNDGHPRLDAAQRCVLRNGQLVTERIVVAVDLGRLSRTEALDTLNIKDKWYADVRALVG